MYVLLIIYIWSTSLPDQRAGSDLHDTVKCFVVPAPPPTSSPLNFYPGAEDIFWKIPKKDDICGANRLSGINRQHAYLSTCV